VQGVPLSSLRGPFAAIRVDHRIVERTAPELPSFQIRGDSMDAIMLSFRLSNCTLLLNSMSHLLYELGLLRP
jgi:hypothetical protein